MQLKKLLAVAFFVFRTASEVIMIVNHQQRIKSGYLLLCSAFYILMLQNKKYFPWHNDGKEAPFSLTMCKVKYSFLNTFLSC